MKGIRISSRYARSLLLLSIERNEVDQVYADMKRVHQAISGSRDLRVFLSSPVVKADTKESVLKSVFGGELSVPSMAFISLLTRKGREGMLGEVASSFIDQVMAHKNITAARVTSASPLQPAVREAVIREAGRLAGGSVELTEEVDPELIGGFVLQVGDHQLDTSVQHNLRNLKRSFSENPFIPGL